MKEIKEWLIVGIITSPYGLKGRLKIKSLSDFKERFTVPGIRWLQEENQKPKPYKLISGFQKPGKDYFIISLEGITNRTQAEKIKKYKILVENSDIPELADEEFHLYELLNLKVKLKTQNKLITIGEVSDLHTENNTLLEVKLYNNDQKVLIPFVRDIIPIIDIVGNFIIINPPKGLLELKY